MAYFEILSGTVDGDAKHVAIPENQPFVLGRVDSCDLLVRDSKVSRRHARITVKDGEYILNDEDSSHGTYLNDKRIAKPMPVSVGDKIRIGQTVLRFMSDSQGPSSPAPQRQIHDADAAEASLSPIDDRFDHLRVLYMDEMMALKKRIHEQILAKLNLPEIATKQIHDEELRAKVEVVLDKVLRSVQHEIPSNMKMPVLREAVLDDLIGYGPITPMLRDPSVTEIMANGASRVFIEREGRITETGCRFSNDRHLLTILQRIVEPLGRRIDESSPMVDARLPDGSRVNAVIPPLAIDGPSLTIRKFAVDKLTADDFISFKTMTPAMADFLKEAVRARQNIIISGGTGSGKTTLLNILSQSIPLNERLVTIEDSAELKLSHRDLVRLESRPDNIEGRGRVTIRDLVINSLRMRPDRIIIGECRGSEALDMLQAMNTGHDGSLTTIHANSPRDALMRLENLVMMAGFDLPSKAIREQIASALNIVVQQTRMVDGARKIEKISEITGTEGNMIMMQDVFEFEQTGFADGGQVVGDFKPTGNIPSFVDELRLKGDLRIDVSLFRAEQTRTETIGV